MTCSHPAPNLGMAARGRTMVVSAGVTLHYPHPCLSYWPAWVSPTSHRNIPQSLPYVLSTL